MVVFTIYDRENVLITVLEKLGSFNSASYSISILINIDII